MMDEKWPFLIIRCYGTGLKNRDFIRCTFDAQTRHPGLVEEIWFAGNALEARDANLACAEESLIYRDECEKRNIRFSYQHGITLNHHADGKKREALFPGDVWAVTSTGETCYGLFCANSGTARAYTQETAEFFLSRLQPDSYWPDDDLRLSFKAKPDEVCFCNRCIRKFNQKFGYDFNREQLSVLLFGEMPSGEIRQKWTQFNAESLAGFAAVFRNAVDRILPSCRLGIQTVFSHWQYDGPDFKPIIDALSGPDRKNVGVRPGACYYDEERPREMLGKILAVAGEAARCKRYGNVGQLCYEAENWPHISARKSPEALMIECSLALASGMDSLALYWGADANAESDENNAFFYDTLAKYKPYFLAIRNAFRNSSLTGGALFHGGNTLAEPEWYSKADPDEIFLSANALPVVRDCCNCDFLILNHRAVRELAVEDLKNVFAGAVLMDTAAFQLLAERFPQLTFPGKVKLQSANGGSRADGKNEAYECFEGNRFVSDFRTVLFPQTPDVRTYSSFTHEPEGAGICTIPTEFGGNVVLCQYLNGLMWNGYRRKTILNALDSVIPGGMVVRLMTNGLALDVLARKDDRTGKTAGAFLLNLSIGETPDLELAIRNPAFDEYELLLPKQKPVKLIPVSDSGEEKRFIIPGLTAWQPALIRGKTQI